MWGVKLTLKRYNETKSKIAHGIECQDIGVPFPIQATSSYKNASASAECVHLLI